MTCMTVLPEIQGAVPISVLEYERQDKYNELETFAEKKL